MRIMSLVRDLEWGGVDRNSFIGMVDCLMLWRLCVCLCFLCAIVGVFTGKFIWSFVCRIYVVNWWAGWKEGWLIDF